MKISKFDFNPLEGESFAQADKPVIKTKGAFLPFNSSNKAIELEA